METTTLSPVTDRWASCSIREFGPSGDRAHLVPAGALNSLCGFSATHPEIWRRDSRKPRCAACVEIENPVVVIPTDADA